jgi:hypothetical protein
MEEIVACIYKMGYYKGSRNASQHEGHGSHEDGRMLVIERRRVKRRSITCSLNIDLATPTQLAVWEMFWSTVGCMTNSNEWHF